MPIQSKHYDRVNGEVETSSRSQGGLPLKIVFFPFAGGTSRIYTQLLDDIRKATRTKEAADNSTPGSSNIKSILSHFRVELCAVDLPGRLIRPNESGDITLTDVPTLAKHMVDEIFLDNSHDYNMKNRVRKGEQYILFGHSFGAILAFEIAKLCSSNAEHGLQPPLALFISASRPPSASSLTSTTGKSVSEMSFDEMKDYFKSRGSSMNAFSGLSKEFEDLLAKSIQADYKCLETYQSNQDTVDCPLFVFGGDNDSIVSVADTTVNWKRHTSDVLFDCNILQGKGHFYLDDNEATNDVARLMVLNIEKTITRANEDAIDIIKSIYATVLQVDVKSLSLESDFFECGGSSLDTIALISQIKSQMDIHVTQNEFFLHPKVVELAMRANEIKNSSNKPPVIQGTASEEGTEYPASPGQEQMLSMWELAPTMYNMPTTIQFTDSLVDVAKLRDAFKFVVEQQPSLRTIVTIDSRSNTFKQRVLPLSQAGACFELRVSKARDDEEARTIIEKESLFEFVMSKPPIVRGVLVEVNDTQTTYLLLNQHHVGSDGWSRTAMRRQLLQAYVGLCTNGRIPDELIIPSHPNYVDWSLWLDRWLNGYGQEQMQLEYWKDKLSGLPLLDLPTDKPRPAILTSRGARIPIIIDKSLTEAFTNYSSKNGANLYAGLIAAYMLMLHRIGGGDDFAIGIALANRHHEGLHELVGYFANEVTIRAQFDDKLRFGDLLSLVRTNILEGMANADVPFHKVTEALNIARDSSRTSVFQAMFALQERNWHSLDDVCPKDGKIQFQLKNQNHNTSKFEVHLQLRHDGQGGLEGDLHISTDLFTVESGERMTQMFKHLLLSCVENPSKSLRAHNIITENDVALIEKCNSTDQNYAKTTMLSFNASPNDVAFVMEHSIVTFREFRSMISAVTSFLQKASVRGQLMKEAFESLVQINAGSDQEQQRIGLLVKSSPAAVAAIYGVANAGMTVVVLDPEKTPADRCRVIFDDSDVDTIIVDDEFMSTFNEIEDEGKGRKLYSLSTAVKIQPPSGYVDMQAPYGPNGVFGIFYTSGTTGKPKGVIVTHSNVVNLLSWWKPFFDVNKTDRILLFSSLSFIMSLRQYIPTLHAGASIVIPKTALDFESAIVSGKVNKLICTPSALAALDIDHVAGGIQAVQVAGEAPRKTTLDAWKARIEKVFIGLGPTELCAHAVCSEYDGETVSIGYPAANVKVYIVDGSTGMQCPVNCIGELWIAGKNVTKGYLHDGELTNKSFAKDVFSDWGMMVYKTGDLAKRLPCGRIQFIGRSDNQLKVNGFRIEGGEILNALPSDVSHAHVMVQGNVLKLFVTPSDIDVDYLKSHLRKQQLPSYMIPTVVHSVDAFPLNKNKKLDVPALLDMIAAHAPPGEVGETNNPDDLNRTEKKLQIIWGQILKTDPHHISVCDNFFSLGGTSLSAVVISRLISKNMQVDISVHDVFIHQSIQTMGELIDQKRINIEESTSDPHPLTFLPGGRNSLHPLLFSCLQMMGLMLMSIVATVPIIATISISVRSFIWFGDRGVVLFPLFVSGGCLLHVLLVVLIKWVTIGRYRVGKAKMFSFYFLKWWLVRRVMQVTQLYTWIIDETRLSSVLLRLLGSKVGHNVSCEQPFLFEPDLVEIGDNCVLEFEAVFATSEIRNGFLELRKVSLGDNVKIGVRSVLLGGSVVHSNCEVMAKTTVDYFTSTTEELQKLVGSPAVRESLKGNPCFEKIKRWRPNRSFVFLFFQLIATLMIIEIMTGTAYVTGALIGRSINTRYGSIGLVVYLGSAFQIISCFIWLVVVVILKHLLIPRIVEGKVYSSSWFALRKWFLDRIFLSPLFSYASRRVLQTSSTYPWYMKLLGAQVGKKAWMNHPYIRVGCELINIRDHFHMGMLAYISTDKHQPDGISFSSINIGDHSSFGQRCVVMAGVNISSFSTVGAETILPFDFSTLEGSTAFGSPPVLFTSTARHTDIIQQTQHFAECMHSMSAGNLAAAGDESLHSNIDNKVFGNAVKSPTTDPSRMQDIGTGKNFWLYVITMILIQGCLPLIIGAAYGSIYFGLTLWLGNLRLEYMLGAVPVIYIIGSVILMLFMKLMSMAGGSFSIGTTDFFSFRFFYWHVFADMVFLCTSTIIYPFSGTEMYCIWLRFMGAKIGKRVFISPENGGFREIDFMTIGNDCVLMTPNIHAHYTDRGKLQFCPVNLEDGCEINPGATIMPLTMYQQKSRLRPFAVTVKGQHCKENTEYVGNPCKEVKEPNEKVTVLFPGQGSQYPGMLQQFAESSSAQDLLRIASETLSMDIEEICSISADATAMQDTRIAQPIVFVADLMAAEMMRQKLAIDFSNVIAVAGFSLGELAALCFAGAITYTDALKLVKVRANAMAPCNGGAMCNLRGVSRTEVMSLVHRFGCKIANIICDHKHDVEKNVYVLAGTSKSIDALITALSKDVEETGIGPKARKLRVSAAFHTDMMKAAQGTFQRALESIDIKFPSQYLVYSNITGQPYKSVQEIRKLLPLQIVSPVQWHDTLIDMVEFEGIEKFIECGPMDTLSKMVSLVLPATTNEQILSSDEDRGK